MNKWNGKDIVRAILLALYILLFWYLFTLFPIVLDWLGSWLYKITGRKEAVIVVGAIVLMVFSVIYAFGKIQGEFFWANKEKEKRKRLTKRFYGSRKKRGSRRTPRYRLNKNEPSINN